MDYPARFRQVQSTLYAAQRHARRHLEQWFYPPVCVLCSGPGDQGLDLCAACRRELPGNLPACTACARVLTRPGVCGACQHRPPPFTWSIAALRYKPPADWLVQRFKFDGRLSYGRVMSELLVEAVSSSRQPLPDALVPVPLHRSRLRERGFNQAREIARVLSRRLSIPIAEKILQRTRATAVQSTLEDVAARRRNLRKAFQAVQEPPAHVALVDDVMTTGSTVAECARELKRAGCRQVSVWLLARA